VTAPHQLAWSAGSAAEQNQQRKQLRLLLGSSGLHQLLTDAHLLRHQSPAALEHKREQHLVALHTGEYKSFW
jgi:hypothetical protein